MRSRRGSISTRGKQRDRDGLAAMSGSTADPQRELFTLGTLIDPLMQVFDAGAISRPAGRRLRARGGVYVLPDPLLQHVTSPLPRRPDPTRRMQRINQSEPVRPIISQPDCDVSLLRLVSAFATHNISCLVPLGINGMMREVVPIGLDRGMAVTLRELGTVFSQTPLVFLCV
jgi:hypothetical protein